MKTTTPPLWIISVVGALLTLGSAALLSAPLPGSASLAAALGAMTYVAGTAIRRAEAGIRSIEMRHSRTNIELGRSRKQLEWTRDRLETLTTRIAELEALTTRIAELERAHHLLRETAERHNAKLAELAQRATATHGVAETALESAQTGLKQASEELQSLRLLAWDLDSRTRDRERSLYLQIESLISIHSSLRPSLPLPNLSGWALSADLAAHIVERILARRPTEVLELGSGASTAVIALTMERAGRGHLTSVEESVDFMHNTQKLLDERGVSHRVTLVHAALSEIDVSGAAYRWYSVDAGALPESPEIVLVDGPSSVEGGSRYPAFPQLADRIPLGGALILDDAYREPEREIARLWDNATEEFAVSWTTAGGKGAAVFTRVRSP